jgi:hypothetical protein
MRVLRFIWQGVLAFDRIGSRIPQLIQIWLIELFFDLRVFLRPWPDPAAGGGRIMDADGPRRRW